MDVAVGDTLVLGIQKTAGTNESMNIAASVTVRGENPPQLTTPHVVEG